MLTYDVYIIRDMIEEMLFINNNSHGSNMVPGSSLSSSNSHSKRKLDVFGDSLVHVDMLLTSLYGAEARKVPAHMVSNVYLLCIYIFGIYRS